MSGVAPSVPQIALKTFPMRSIVFFAYLAGLLSLAGAAPAKEWKSFVLWENKVVSATLKYLPEASPADDDYMFVELENHTGQELNVEQASIGLPGTRTDKKTG